jgi:hypothetical protein
MFSKFVSSKIILDKSKNNLTNAKTSSLRQYITDAYDL